MSAVQLGRGPISHVRLQVRLTPESFARAEEWVAKYCRKIKRADVLRTIFEMGLDQCDVEKGLDLSPREKRPGRVLSFPTRKGEES